MISRKADAAIESLSFKAYCTFTETVDGAVGTIKDCKGNVLWADETSVGADIYNLIGDLNISYSENTVSNRNKEYITNADEYDLAEGVKSLENTALDVNTTLDYELHKAIYEYMKSRGITNGSALFVDADTGAIRAAVSLPAADPAVSIEEWGEGALINKNFSATIPGSTMKVITGMLLTEINPKILERFVYCGGKYYLPGNQASVTCITQRGTHNLTSALGVSCNCYYADSIVNVLNTNAERVKVRLEELGISECDYTHELGSGNISCSGSTAAYDGSNSFTSVWSMIGEGDVRISPLDLCRITSGIVNGGMAKEPYILDSVTDSDGEVIRNYSGEDSVITDSNTAEKFYSIWKSAYDTHYGSEYHSEITLAKSGTAEYDNHKGVSKNLVGYLEEERLVFFIEIADYKQSHVMPLEVVNYVCEMR